MATKGPRRHHRRLHTKPMLASSTELIPPGPTSVHHLPDHILELVLLRLGSSLALLRAAFTCKSWRSIIADTEFLSRFRPFHEPHVAGHYHIVHPSHDRLPPDGNNQVFVPDTSTANALNRRHFALDFLPDQDWELGDIRGGLLLLYRRNIRWYRRHPELLFPDMIVCDPLTRRYQGILSWEEMYQARCLGIFLLDGIAADDTGSSCISMSNFRVVVVVYGTPTACVFTSGSDGGWQENAANSGGIPLPEFRLISFVGRVGPSLYWRMEGEGVVLALDETTLEFSLVTFPYTVVGWPDESSAFRVIGGPRADLRIIRIIDKTDLAVFAQLQGSGEWVIEKLVRLPQATCKLPGYEETYSQPRPPKIVTANMRYVLVKPQEDVSWIVSVDLQKLEVEWVHERNNYSGEAYPYELPWPPALQACRAGGRQAPQED